MILFVGGLQLRVLFGSPLFTELYYLDPANKGSPELKRETSDTFRSGLYQSLGIMDFGFEGFYRRGKNLIDWIRVNPADIWQATNLGRADFWGGEYTWRITPRMNGKVFRISESALSYTYTVAQRSSSGFFSKYALDVLKHQMIEDLNSLVLGVKVELYLSYNQRYYGEKYFLGNIYFGKEFGHNGFSCEPFIAVDNFSNTKYTEITGVLEPGRWIKGGVKLAW